MTPRALTLELLTEELPPKALQALSNAFAKAIEQQLEKQGLLADGCRMQAYATPRRLAVTLDAVLGQAPEQHYAIKLMPVHIGLDADGHASPALRKKLAARGLAALQPDELVRRQDGQQEILYAEGTAPGTLLADGLQGALDFAVAHLPIPKLMQYQLADGRTSVKFVRPAHHLLALWGSDVVPVNVLGLRADRVTRGHRFMSHGTLEIATADAWAQTLEAQAHVIPAFAKRRAIIAQQLERTAADLGACLGTEPAVEALLDEVTALVEYPTVYVGTFEKEFLAVPPECLILTMRLNQKYFPLFEPGSGTLTHRFLIVSNMRPKDPTNIVQGNQRVVRPRLADAQFFYQTDLKTPLAERVPTLARSVYHAKLGSQLQRTERVQAVARELARQLGVDPDLAARAAWLAHADLNTQMVGEFPELQGIMGAYYAAHDGEPDAVVQALRMQYRVHLDAPVTADSQVAVVLYMAERIETLVGIWGAGQAPTGERDPYGLRRAALGLISAYEQLVAGGLLAVSEPDAAALPALLAHAAGTFPDGTIPAETPGAVMDFVYARYRNQLLTRFAHNPVDAVLALQPPLHQVLARVEACVAFMALPESAALASANKRIGNMLKKSDGSAGALVVERLNAPAAQQLAQTLARLAPEAQAALQAGDFAGNLRGLARARADVDRFFDEVMVMDPDPQVRANRLALLGALHDAMNQVADLARLAA